MKRAKVKGGDDVACRLPGCQVESVYLGVDSVNTQRDRPEVGGLQLAPPTSLPGQEDVGGALTVELL